LTLISFPHQGLNLNKLFVELINSSDDLDLVTEPSLTLSVFRLVPKPALHQPEHSLQSLNDLNRIYHSRLSSRNDIFLVQTNINGISCIRFAIGAQRTTEKHIQDAYKILEDEAQLAIATWKGKGTNESA
jgi:aromatic-L-amino-acid decarboxylase